MRLVIGSLIVVCAAVMPAAAAAELPVHSEFRGVVDLGMVVTDDTVSWLDGGTGKGRYGAGGNGDRRIRGVVPEASLIHTMSIGASWNVLAQVKYDDQQHVPIDIAEAWVQYRSPPSPGVRWRVKAGTFLPPVSLENEGIAWTSPYTLTSSALNSWVGEELRTNGVEVRALLDGRRTDIDVYGAVYFANDPAGKVIYWRGWAVHDRELTLFDRVYLPDFQMDLIWPTGPFGLAAPYYEPTHEVDGRPGFYAGVDVSNDFWGRFSVHLYHNNADPRDFNPKSGQYGWRTRFATVGYHGELGDHLTLIAQGMVGDTIMGPRMFESHEHPANMLYYTGYVMLSREFDKWRTSVRGEYFATRDLDPIRWSYDNDEDGFGLTLAGQYRLTDRLRVALELQYLDHARPVRAYGNLPVEISELSARANLRWFF